jgi:hypothetical protein
MQRISKSQMCDFGKYFACLLGQMDCVSAFERGSESHTGVRFALRLIGCNVGQRPRQITQNIDQTNTQDNSQSPNADERIDPITPHNPRSST